MNTVVQFESAEQEEDANPIICHVCEQWDMLSAHWLLYDDGSFRCVTCGTGFDFEEDV